MISITNPVDEVNVEQKLKWKVILIDTASGEVDSLWGDYSKRDALVYVKSFRARDVVAVMAPRAVWEESVNAQIAKAQDEEDAAMGAVQAAIHQDFTTALQGLIDNAEFTTLSSIALMSSWVESRFAELVARVGANVEDNDPRHELELYRNGDATADDAREYEQLGLPVPAAEHLEERLYALLIHDDEQGWFRSAIPPKSLGSWSEIVSCFKGTSMVVPLSDAEQFIANHGASHAAK